MSTQSKTSSRSQGLRITSSSSRCMYNSKSTRRFAKPIKMPQTTWNSSTEYCAWDCRPSEKNAKSSYRPRHFRKLKQIRQEIHLHPRRPQVVVAHLERSLRLLNIPKHHRIEARAG